jgi:hypothetical protein
MRHDLARLHLLLGIPQRDGVVEELRELAGVDAFPEQDRR